MKVQLKPEFHIVENCGLFSVVPVGNNGKSIGGWLAMHAPALGEGSHRPQARVSISKPDDVGTAAQWCRGEDWQVLSHKMFRARRWPSPWEVVR
jgi:hypothetical protein